MPRLATHLKTCVAAAAVAAVLPAAASAAPALDGTFTPSAAPGHITNGPDGAVWFTLPGGAGSKDFGRIAPNGTISEFDTPNNVMPSDITFGPNVAGGPNNRLWLDYNGGVVKVDPANPGAGTDFPIATIAGPRDIAPDRDGNLWVITATGLTKVAPTGTKIADVAAGAGGRDIALGGDGRMWWADFGGSAIQATQTAAPYTTTKITDTTTAPQGIAAGPGTQVAFGSPNSLLGRVGPAGGPQYTTDAGADAGFGIVLGGDGAYWTTRFVKDGLGRLTSAGAYTTPIALPAGSGPRSIATGPNNTLWVVLETSKKIARITGVTPPAVPGTPGTAADKVKPRLAKLKINVAKRRLSVRLSEAASLRLSIEKRTYGKRKGKKCLAAKKGRKGKRCVRYVKVRSLRKAGKAGANTMSMGKKLKPARYRVSLVAVDKAGNRSATARKGFTVHKPKKSRKRK
jgi:virginiamycin B lyase